MEAFERRQPLRASERPLRATGSSWERASGGPGSVNPVTGENGDGGAERRNVRHFQLRCSEPCMPAVGKVGNRITWNHFLLWRGPPAGAPLGPGGPRHSTPPLPCASPRNFL